jgi:hypothetical protein
MSVVVNLESNGVLTTKVSVKDLEEGQLFIDEDGDVGLRIFEGCLLFDECGEIDAYDFEGLTEDSPLANVRPVKGTVTVNVVVEG